jgi:tetratricopeptide (TPR) repeat protein
LAGRYEILREIGRGGMSQVFLARDLRLDREVALKALRPELTESVGAGRFQREIQLVAHFEHLHLLQLYEAGTADGVLYYVMPYARDGSLRDRLRKEGLMGLDPTVRITAEVAEGIAHAHQRGVVHRDIKPENVLFVDGHAVVADFGIAHAYSEAGGETFTDFGIAIGTPPYMSPEQVAGEPRIDHRSDIYALGCVVFEMLAGGPPFDGPTVQAILAKHIRERVPSLSVVRPGIPAGMVAAVEKALEKVPGDRYDTAVEFAAALEQGRQRPAAGRSWLKEVVAPYVRRHAGVVVAALLATIGLTIGAILLTSRVEPGFTGRPASVVVVPFHAATASDSERAIVADLASRITRELGNWESIRAASGVSLNGAMFDLGLTGPTLERVEDGVRVAQHLRVQALLTVSVSLQGDSAHAEAMLYDAATRKPVGQALHAQGLAAQPGALVTRIAYGVLGLGDLTTEPEELRRWSANPDALLRDMQGTQFLERWRLREAERSLREAVALDSGFAMARYHLAQTVYWRSVEQTAPSVDLQPEIARQSTAALRHVTGLPARDSLHILGFHAFQDGDYAAARRLYRSLLRTDSTDVYAWLMLGSVEYHDRWLQRGAGGALAPRANLNLAVRAFTEAVRLQPRFDLGYGHLGDIYRLVADVARGGGCPGFERPRDEPFVDWQTQTPYELVAFCPVARDTLVWLPKRAFDALAPRDVVAGADRLMEQWTRRLRRWAGYAPQEPKPRIELARAVLDQRRRLGIARPETIDSLARLAAEYTAQALALERDTLPDDLVWLGAVLVGAGELDSALAVTGAALTRFGTGAPPSLAANVYVASGQPARALPLIASGIAESYIPDTASGSLIAYGGADRVVERIRALGATGIGGLPLQHELQDLARIWSDPKYSARDRQLLREHVTSRIAVALSQDRATLASWGAGLTMGAPLWRALALSETDSTAARAYLDQARRQPLPGINEAELTFLLGVLAGRVGDHRLAVARFSRLDSLALSLDEFDPTWGLHGLSYLLRADAFVASNQPDSARAYYTRFSNVWHHADSLAMPLVERARSAVRRLARDD